MLPPYVRTEYLSSSSTDSMGVIKNGRVVPMWMLQWFRLGENGKMIATFGQIKRMR